VRVFGAWWLKTFPQNQIGKDWAPDICVEGRSSGKCVLI
jgi:hypothetical protein